MHFLREAGINNLFVGHYHFGLQFIILSLFYRSLFLQKQKKMVVVIIAVVFTVLFGYYIINPEMYVEFNLIDVFITTVPLIFFSILYLYNTLTKPEKHFVLNAALLMYLSTSALLFFLGTYIHAEGELLGLSIDTAFNIWIINNTIYLIFLIFLIVEWHKTLYKWKTRNS